MIQSFNNNVELLLFAKEKTLYQKLVSQLQKDFALSNIDIDLNLEISPEELVSVLHEKIYVLILERFSEYLNLLYIIDVPEKAFKNIAVTDVVDVAAQVTFLVLQRELQKVHLKAKYS